MNTVCNVIKREKETARKRSSDLHPKPTIAAASEMQAYYKVPIVSKFTSWEGGKVLENPSKLYTLAKPHFLFVCQPTEGI